MKLKLKESWNPSDITNVYKAINAGLVDDDDIESMRNYLQQIIDYCIGMANDYHIVLRYDTGEDLTECDSAEATQPADIAKKEEYKELVIPTGFKKGKKLKEAELDALNTKDINKALQLFDTVMKNKGYSVYINDEDGYSGMAVSKDDDPYKCIFDLTIWRYPKSVSLFVEDRNGNFYLGGNTAAIYSVEIDDHIDNEVLERIETMVDTAINKYGEYSSDNRLDFASKGTEEEREKF